MGFKPSFVEFTNDIFPNIEFSPGGETTPEGARPIKYVCSPWKPFANWRKPWRWKNKRDERFNNYVKWAVDPFRDYVFERYGFKPEKKKRLLYVPRMSSKRNEEGGWVIEPGVSATNGRIINNVEYESALKDWCGLNGYEYVHWLNNSGVPIIEQAKMYAESDIVVGVTGSDFTNAYFMDSESLIVEIMPPAKHFPGGMNESFKSEATIKSLEENWGLKWSRGYNLSDACERNIKYIYALDYKITKQGDETVISKKNINDTIDILNARVNKQVMWEI